MDIYELNYSRVCPRDLFNEAKLLKCLGKLSLKILDGCLPETIEFIQDSSEEPFKIARDESSGGLVCLNLTLYKNDEVVHIKSSLNSKDNYPLYYLDDIIGFERVFNEDGSFTGEFLNFVKR